MDLERYEIAELGLRERVTYAEGDRAAFYLHIFKAGFHLPLGRFFCGVMEEYGLSPNQLKPNSWAILVTYFLVCREKGWRPAIGVVKELYVLKRAEPGFYYLQAREGGRMVVDLPSNAHMRRDQFFVVTKRADTEWGFPLRWGMMAKANNQRVALEDTEKDQVLFFRGGAVSSRVYLTFRNIQRECLGRDLEDVPEGLVYPVGRQRRRRLLRRQRGKTGLFKCL